MKPLLIYVDAHIIDPLIELLNYTAKTENYTLKQVKLNQVKIQTTTPDVYHKIVQAFKVFKIYNIKML